MMDKTAQVDFARCDPRSCNSGSGACPAALECPRHLLEQEELFTPPLLLSARLCSGCGTCAGTCPLKAISIRYG
jgi:ATP-binding cassette subfamily E protein 1